MVNRNACCMSMGLQNTTFSSWYVIEEVSEEAATIPIGYPISNTQMHILDHHMCLVPVGVVGELYVGGEGLASGYLQRPDLTAERFVPDPFNQKAGALLYRTGDLVRRLAGGEIEFLRRLDTQVKLRGFRIELGQIEVTLNQHPGVREAAVALQADFAEQKRLIAYIVADPITWESMSQEENALLPVEHVTHWQMIFDEQIYGQAITPLDPTFHIAGWNSSISGLPFAPQDMQTWLDDTIQAIQELRPQRVLEIGCGTGLLLFRLAPHR